MNKGVVVFSKENLSVVLFSDHHNGIAVQLIQRVKQSYKINQAGDLGERDVNNALLSEVISVHSEEDKKKIRPAVQKAIDKMKVEVEKICQSVEHIDGILTDYKSQSGGQ